MINFITLIFFSYSFIFYGSDVSFLKANDQRSKTVDYWHLDFFKQTSLPILTGKNVKIAILDSEIHPENSHCDKISEFEPNFNDSESFDNSLVGDQKNQKHSSGEVQKIGVSKTFLQKNHGNLSISIIKQLAPEATIITIPVLDDRGYAHKEGVYQALKLAKKHKPDILHLSFQILDFDPNQKLDKKIQALLAKFPCVIVPSGNHVKVSNFPPQLPRVFCVASFGFQKYGYPISNFCQNQGGADFVMPGEKLWTQIWVPELQDSHTFSVCGTSFSASLMTGFVALLLEQNHKKIAKTIKDLKQHSTFLDYSWQGMIRYGFAHF